MRADAAASEDLLAQINRLRVENDELRSKAIQGLNQEEIDNLANIESVFKIRYSYQEYRSPNVVTLNDSVSISWKAIFVAVAPQFAKPKTNGIKASTLRDLFVENRLIPAARGAAQLFHSDLNTVFVQMHAYGLIASEEAGAGDGSVDRFTRLTPVGLRRQLEWSTVKSTQG